MKLQSVACIWDKGEHNAFTDLCRFRGHFYCIFREASAHVSDEADLRILRSDDGTDWHSVALLKMPGKDLRDGKLLAKEDRLLVYGAAVDRTDSTDPHNCLESWVWQSTDGVEFSEPKITVSDSNYWLWRVRQARGGSGYYGVAYRAGPEGDVRLYRSDNGLDFDCAVAPLNSSGYVNEADMLFAKDSAEILLRRDPVWGPEFTGLLGTAKTPFKEWSWLELSCRIGGPVMFEWQSRLFAVVRLYDDNVRTALVEINRDNGEVTERLTLPSQGDTSYAGGVLEEDILNISYYSSHEGKTNIYFARVVMAN